MPWLHKHGGRHPGVQMLFCLGSQDELLSSCLKLYKVCDFVYLCVIKKKNIITIDLKKYLAHASTRTEI